MNGILNVKKPGGMTSFTVVAKVRRLCGVKRIGHAGTLDPMATGVLPLLIGKAAVMQEMLTDHDKTYLAGVRFGMTTDTGDITGNTIKQCEVDLSQTDIENTLMHFRGEIMQTPPMYSAIQIDGKRLYDLARKGIEVERPSRRIEIYSLEIVQKVSDTDYVLRVDCSKGTYIRTLCEDIGNSLGVGACLYSLERTRCGIYDEADSVSLDELEAKCASEGISAIESLLMPVEPLFCDLPELILPEFFTTLCLNGCEIYLDKLRDGNFKNTERCRVYTFDKRFIGMGVVADFPDGKAVKIKYRFI